MAGGCLALAACVVGFICAKALLCVDTPVEKADIIVILGGYSTPRIEQAVDLFRARRAPYMVFTEQRTALLGHRALQEARIPKTALLWETHANSTKENAEFTVRILRAHGFQSAILVTSWYHSRRALSAFQHFAPDLKFYSMPSYHGIGEGWLPPVAQASDVFKEYVKTVGYLFWHGIGPVVALPGPPSGRLFKSPGGGHPLEEFSAVASMRLRFLLLAAAIGAAVCSLLIPGVQKLLRPLGALSRTPQFHHAGSANLSRLGGIALCGSFLAVAAAAFAIYPQNLRLNQPHLALTLTAMAMFGLGLLDDLRPMPAHRKLACQIVIAVFAWLGGVRIDLFRSPLSGLEHSLGYWGSLATVFWLVALTNLLNMVDGIDGLAAGIGFILMALLAILPLNGPWPFPLLVAVGMAGALLIFLHYNFPPAKIYLGDGGAYLLGFLIGGLSIVNSHKGSIVAALVVPLFGLAVPIADASLAIVRRWFKGLPLFRPDRKHIHHRLVKLGFSRRRAVLTLYALSILFLLLAFALFWSDGRVLALTAGLVFLGLVWLARTFGLVKKSFDISSLLAQGIELRKETRKADSLGRWLEQQADRANSIEALWLLYEQLADGLGFDKVVLFHRDERHSWQRAGRLPAPDDLHHERHEFPADHSAIEFCGEKSRLKPVVFEHLTELAAEGWMKTFQRWKKAHPSSLEFLESSPDRMESSTTELSPAAESPKGVNPLPRPEI